MVSLDSFLQVNVGVYKRSFTSKNTVLVEYLELHFKSAKWKASFIKEATADEFPSKVCDNVIFQRKSYVIIVE